MVKQFTWQQKGCLFLFKCFLFHRKLGIPPQVIYNFEKIWLHKIVMFIFKYSNELSGSIWKLATFWCLYFVKRYGSIQNFPIRKDIRNLGVIMLRKSFSYQKLLVPCFQLSQYWLIQQIIYFNIPTLIMPLLQNKERIWNFDQKLFLWEEIQKVTSNVNKC